FQSGDAEFDVMAIALLEVLHVANRHAAWPFTGERQDAVRFAQTFKSDTDQQQRFALHIDGAPVRRDPGIGGPAYIDEQQHRHLTSRGSRLLIKTRRKDRTRARVRERVDTS